MTVQCPDCQRPVEPRVGTGGALACPRCACALSPSTKPQSGTAPAEQGSKALATKADPNASGFAQAMSDKPTLGSYVIIGEVGRGGMGRVYKAVHKTLRQVRPLKLLARRESSDARGVSRVQREARMV